MLATSLSTVDWILDRYLLAEEEVVEARGCICDLKVESVIERIADILRMTPAQSSDDIEKLTQLDVSEFAYDIAQSLLPKINGIKEDGTRRMAAEHLGQIVQFSGLDIWESVKAHRPNFIKDFLTGFKRFKAKQKIHNKVFFDSMAPGYLYGLQKKQISDKKTPKILGLLPQASVGKEPRVFRDSRKIEFNKSTPCGKQPSKLYDAFKDYGLVKDIRTLKGFFKADDQCGSRVRCYGAKRNHIALLFDTLLKENILVLHGGKGHWKVLEECFVDEQGKPLSKSFSKLLSKLMKDREAKSAIFAEIERIMQELRK